MDNILFFVLSNDQMKEMKSTAAKVGGKYTPGTVTYKGKIFQYTEKLTNPNMSRYSDAKVVASGSNLTYTEPRYL